VKQLLTSVVREICTLRSVGAGARATAPGHPVAISNGRPYRDLTDRAVSVKPDYINYAGGTFTRIATLR